MVVVSREVVEPSGVVVESDAVSEFPVGDCDELVDSACD